MSSIAHVHSTFSDGTATVAELRAFARAAGARVLLLTDHDTLGARDAGQDGWGEDVLVVTGHEVSPRGGHLLVFDVPAVIDHAGRDERAILDAVADAGGFGIAAHPFSRGSAMSTTIGRPHPWSTFDHPALAGIEVWSLTTEAAEGWGSPLAAARDLRDPARVVAAGPAEDNLRRWDAIAARGPRGGLGGLDGHAPGVRVGGRVRSIMPHDRWMGVHTQLHLDAELSGEDVRDTATVLRSLRAGATAIVAASLGEPSRVRASWSAGGRALTPGAAAPVAGARLRVDAPASRVLRDGTVVAQDAGGDGGLELEPTEPGLYRVELLTREHRRWVLPSPVVLTS